MKKSNNIYLNLIEFLSSSGIIKLSSIFIVLNLLITILFSYILFPNLNVESNKQMSIIAFVSIVVIIPVFETFFFQSFIIGYFVSKNILNFLSAAFLSSILFAIAHFYSLEYIIKTFISGFLYGTLYLVALKKIKYPFLPVAIAHATFNFIGFCIDLFLN